MTVSESTPTRTTERLSRVGGQTRSLSTRNSVFSRGAGAAGATTGRYYTTTEQVR